MKYLFILLAALSFSPGINAQDGNIKIHQHERVKKDRVIMKDGKMMLVSKDTWTPLDKEMAMSDGSVVMNDGTVRRKDGTTVKLKEGEGLDMNGRMMHRHGGRPSK